MSLRRYFQRLGQWWQKRSQERQDPKSATRLGLEVLEDRTVPAIVFGSAPTTMVQDNGGPLLANVHVELIFWGAGWNSNLAFANQLQSSVDRMVASPYLSSLSQYRPGLAGLGSGTLVGTVFVTNSSPNAAFTNEDVDQMLKAQFTSGGLPQPSSDGQLLYMVIPQPGSDTPPAEGILGAHGADSFCGARFHYGWTVNAGNPSSRQLDSLTSVISHELVEAVSDPELGSGVVIGGEELADNQLAGVGDISPQSYHYRLNGVLVQSYFSQVHHAYIVPDGQTQNFLVSNGELTVNGDQNAPFLGDTITLDQTSAGGVRVKLNGAVAQFDSDAINNIVVRPGEGINTINIERTANNAPVRINISNNAPGNEIGAVDLVAICPTSQNLDNLGGKVTINGNGLTTLTVADQADSFSDTFTITDMMVTRNAAAEISYSNVRSVVLNGGYNQMTYQVQSTAPGTTLSLNAGSGANTINLGTGNLGTLKGAVIVHGQSDADTINLMDQQLAFSDSYTITNSTVNRSSSGPTPFAGLTYDGVETLTLKAEQGNNRISVTNIGFGMTVNIDGGGGSNDQLVVADNPPTSTDPRVSINQYTISSTQLTHQFGYTLGTPNFYLSPRTATITYSGLEGVEVNTGNLDDQIFIPNTAASVPLTVNTGLGNNTVIVNGTSNQQNTLLGPLTVNGQGNTQLILDDETATGGIRYTLTTPTLTRLVAGVSDTITYSGLASLTINAGKGNDVVNARSVTAGTRLAYNGNGGTDELLGANVANTWILSGANSGTLNGSTASVTFTQVEKLTGGSGADTFVFQKGGSISGAIDGLGGVDTLDCSLLTSSVMLNLLTGQALLTTPATPLADSVLNIENANGGAGNDILIGNAAANVLKGGGGNDLLVGLQGNDTLDGGADRDLLFGGDGADTLTGGSGENLLVAGTTSYTDQGTVNLAALSALMVEWSRTGTRASYEDRVGNLRAGVGTGLFRLSSGTTVFEDTSTDKLTGSSTDLDWFFALASEVTNLHQPTQEHLNNR